jgi:hypothetical protein
MGALATVVACLGCAASAEAYIYYGNAMNIGRANNDGTGVTPNFIPSGGFACGVAVTDTHIYWGYLGGVGRANIDGTNPEYDFYTAPVTTPISTDVCGVAVSDTHVYWATRGPTPSVGRANLDGSSPEPDWLPLGGEACGIATDDTHVYWASYGSGTLLRSSLSTPGVQPVSGTMGPSNCSVGVGPQLIYYGNYLDTSATSIGIVTKAGIGYSGVSGVRAPCGIDVHGSNLYWTNYVNPLGGPGQGAIGVVPIDEFGTPTATPPNQTLLRANEPCGVVVDDRPLPPPPPPGGDATFAVGRATLDKKKGTAKLLVTTTGAGTLDLTGKLVKTASATLAGAGDAQLTVKAKGKAKKALKKKGKAKVSYTVAFTPASGTPSSKDGVLKLKRKRKR